MNTNIIKRLKDIEKLHEVETFLLDNGRPITDKDEEILVLVGKVMEDYAYGWDITNEGYFEQLRSINKFKLYILNEAFKNK